MVRDDHSDPSTSFSSRSGRSNHYAFNRPKLKYCFLRPCWRRRPSSVSTPVLILRPSRSIHSNSPRVWNDLSRSFTLLSQRRAFWHPRNNLCHTWNWNSGVYRVSTPYIYCRYRRRHPSLLYSCHDDYCCTNRN